MRTRGPSNTAPCRETRRARSFPFTSERTQILKKDLTFGFSDTLPAVEKGERGRPQHGGGRRGGGGRVSARVCPSAVACRTPGQVAEFIRHCWELKPNLREGIPNPYIAAIVAETWALADDLRHWPHLFAAFVAFRCGMAAAPECDNAAEANILNFVSDAPQLQVGKFVARATRAWQSTFLRLVPHQWFCFGFRGPCHSMPLSLPWPFQRLSSFFATFWLCGSLVPGIAHIVQTAICFCNLCVSLLRSLRPCQSLRGPSAFLISPRTRMFVRVLVLSFSHPNKLTCHA